MLPKVTSPVTRRIYSLLIALFLCSASASQATIIRNMFKMLFNEAYAPFSPLVTLAAKELIGATQTDEAQFILSMTNDALALAGEAPALIEDLTNSIEKPITEYSIFITSGEIADDWIATQMAAGGNYLYWTEGDQTLYQGRVENGEIVGDVARLTHDWVATQFAVDDEFLYWTEGDGILHQARVEDGRVVGRIELTHDWVATGLTADGGYIYWTEGDEILHQARVEGGRVVGRVELAHDWIATQFAASGSRMYWVDGTEDLYCGVVKDEGIHHIVTPASDWIATLVTADNQLLYWTDGDNRLRLGGLTIAEK